MNSDNVTASVGPTLCAPPTPLYRVARADDPLRFSRISAADALLIDSGNRFDVTGADVLYCATEPLGCYVETIWRFRPTAGLRVRLVDEPGFVVCGVVPAEWRRRRVLVELDVVEAEPFLDVESPETHEYLNTAMATQLHELGVDALDVGLVRGRHRLITRAIASWAYSATTSSGTPLFSGLRYVSRFGNEECWAAFDRCTITETNRDPINANDRDLYEAARRLGIIVR